MRRALVLLLLLLPAAPAAAATTERQLAAQQRPTAVKAHGGIALFSQWDGAAYRLVIARGTGVPERLPVPPQDEPFDADIGPDAQGRPTVVLSTCTAEDCDLSLLRLGAARPTPLPRTDDPDNPESRPTISGGTIAWVRQVGSAVRAVDRVFSRSLTATGRSTSHPGVPSGGEVRELELSGRRLALSTVAYENRGGVCGEREVRLVTLGRAAVTRVASQLCGLNGQTYAGPSFVSDHVYFARACNDERACSGAAFGVLRYRIADGALASAPQQRPLAGFAYAGGGRSYEGRATCTTFEDQDEAPPCTVVRVSGLRLAALPR